MLGEWMIVYVTMGVLYLNQEKKYVIKIPLDNDIINNMSWIADWRLNVISPSRLSLHLMSWKPRNDSSGSESAELCSMGCSLQTRGTCAIFKRLT